MPTDQTFDGIDYTKEPLQKGDYEYCVFKNCQFAEVDLSGFLFSDTEFVECNLSNVKIEGTTFQDVKFKDCKMLGLHFEDCSYFGPANEMDNCQLNFSSFFKMKLDGVVFKNSVLHGVDFEEASMIDAILTDCDLLDARFSGANLENADLRKSINYRIDPRQTKVKGAQFSLPDALALLNGFGVRVE